MNSLALHQPRHSVEPHDIRASRGLRGFARNTSAAEMSATPRVDGPPAGNAERRQAIRRVPGLDEHLSHLRVRAGLDLTVVDFSAAGALVESLARPLPGTYMNVRINTGASHIVVRSRVVRAHVCHVEAHLVRYRVAIAFDRMIETEHRPLPAWSHEAVN